MLDQPHEQRAHDPAVDRGQQVLLRGDAQERRGLDEAVVGHAQAQQHLVARGALGEPQRMYRLQEQFEALVAERLFDLGALPGIAHRSARRLALAVDLGGEAQEQRREPLLERIETLGLGAVGIETEARRAADLAVRAPYRDHDDVAPIFLLLRFDRGDPAAAVRERILDEFVILGQQEILAEPQRVARGIVERDALHLGGERAHDLRE